MASNTYCERVNIIKYVKPAKGWRFAPVAKRPNGSIHWDHVLIGGTAQAHPKGTRRKMNCGETHTSGSRA